MVFIHGFVIQMYQHFSQWEIYKVLGVYLALLNFFFSFFSSNQFYIKCKETTLKKSFVWGCRVL